ncbi:MAG: AMP-binding protein, partial [Alcaligenaceae bacterium]|nr:AMP-binding protein [Alcaligenaceae bacterium]
MTDPVLKSLADESLCHPDWRPDDHLLTLLADNAQRYPNEVAMREYDHGVWQEYTWARYLDEVLNFAAGLERCGVGQGDIVLVVGDNRPALYFGMLGVI